MRIDTPVKEYNLKDRKIFVKRDDLMGMVMYYHRGVKCLVLINC